MKKEDFLLYKPVLIHKEFKEENGIITLIFYHNSKWAKLISWIAKKPKVTYLDLDELGSYFWSNSNGEKTVELLIEEMSVKFNDNTKSMETRVIKFAEHLAVKGYLGFK